MTGIINILHLIPSLEVGGAEQSLVTLATNLDRARFRNTVVSMTDLGPMASRLMNSEIPVVALGMRRGRPSLRAFTKLRCLIRSIQPQIVQTWLYHADLMGLAATRSSPIPSLSWNIRCSNLDLVRYRPLTRIVILLLARLSSRPNVVVCNSEAGKKYHSKLGFRPRAWRMIPNGFDGTHFKRDPIARSKIRAELQISSEKALIGLVGRLDPAKDHETFLQAAKEVVEFRRDTHFLVVGTGVSALRSKVDAYGLRESLVLWESRSDISQVMSALDIGCLSSAWGEGFPNVLGEMMATEIPCITTNVGDAALIVGETGWVVPPSLPSVLAKQIVNMLDLPPSERTLMGQKARQKILREYSVESTLTQYTDLYESLIKESL